MAKSATSRPSARVVQLRKGATLEMVRRTCLFFFKQKTAYEI